jgi:hypothetical protein
MAIQRNLPLTDKYQVLHISRPGIEGGTGCSCANCGKTIVNSAAIVNQKGEQFRVGLDCVKTLTKQVVNCSEYDDMMYSFNACLRFATLMNKADKVEQDEVFVTIYYKNAKGEAVVKNEFKKPFVDFGFKIPE